MKWTPNVGQQNGLLKLDLLQFTLYIPVSEFADQATNGKKVQCVYFKTPMAGGEGSVEEPS